MREKERNRNNVRRWCANQSNGFITPEHRRFRRAHGLQLPLHPQQVTGWIVISIIIINTFVVLTPHIEQNLRSILTTVVTGIFVTHICSHLIVLLMDPADPRVRSQPSNKILPEFDRNKHLHVIENGRCHLCNITTDNKRTKHCSICNKCIVRFDHHCKWLNNCIGARNYLAFLICLVSAILASLFVAGLSMTELTLSFFGGTLNYIEPNRAMGNMTATIVDPLIVPVSDTATLIVIFTIGLLSAIVAILLLHLCFFHSYIACLGLTTYEYVRKKREKNSVATAVVIAAAAAAAAAVAPAGGGSEAATATAGAGNPTTVAVSSNVVKLAEDTVHGNSSSIQTVSNRTSGHDFSEISPAGYCHESIIQNNTDLYPVPNTQEQIVFGATPKSIVLQSLLSYCRNKREMTHICVNRYVEHPQLKLESSREIRTTIIEQSTSMAQNLTADLPVPSSHIYRSATLYSITTSCCSGKNSAEKSKGRYNDNASSDIATESTKTCLAIERIQKRFRVYLNNGSDKTCRVDANASQQSFDIKLNTLGETMSEMNTNRGTDKTICSKNTGSIVHSLALLNEAPAIIESHSSTKLQTVQSTLIAEPNQCVIGDYATVRRQETFEPSTHDKYLATRFTSRKKAAIKISHISPPAKLSPILESELSPPINTRSPNPSQNPASAHSMLFTYTPATPHLSHIESLSSMRSFIPRFTQSSSEI